MMILGIQKMLSWFLPCVWSLASDQGNTGQKIMKGTLVEDTIEQNKKHPENCASISFKSTFGEFSRCQAYNYKQRSSNFNLTSKEIHYLPPCKWDWMRKRWTHITGKQQLCRIPHTYPEFSHRSVWCPGSHHFPPWSSSFLQAHWLETWNFWNVV